MNKEVKENKDIITEINVKESRPKKSKYDNKQRSTINVSLQKRNLELLNSILNGWVEDGYNISNEICNAIIFKNKSDINPHIQTILSTLSLIESSLKSQRISKSMSDDEIGSKALEIFNEVITIDIDGTKLTNLLKSVNMPVKKQISNKTEIENTSQNTSEYISENILENNTVQIQSEKEIEIQDNISENEIEQKEISATVEIKDKVKNVELTNKNTEQQKTLDWSNSFPKEKIGEKKTNENSINNDTTINNNLIKGFVANPGFI